MLQNLWLPGEARSLGGRVSLEVWDERVHSAIFQTDTQRGPTVQRRER